MGSRPSDLDFSRKRVLSGIASGVWDRLVETTRWEREIRIDNGNRNNKRLKNYLFLLSPRYFISRNRIEINERDNDR